MTPELEVLEQVLDSPIPLAVIAILFPDSERCMSALEAMIRDGQVFIRDATAEKVPKWRFRELSSDPTAWQEGSGFHLEITDRGVEMIS